MLSWLTTQLRHRRVSRPDARRAAWRAARPATIATRSCAALCRPEPMGELSHPQLETLRAGRGAGHAGRRHADAAARRRSARRTRSTRRRATCCSSTKWRAPVPARSDADAAAAERPARRARRRSSSASCRGATSRAAASDRARRDRATCWRISRSGAVRLSVRPHRPAPTHDAAVRRPRARRRRAPARARSSKKRRWSERDDAHSSDRRLRHGDGDAGGDAEAARATTSAARTRTSTRR